MIVKLHNHPILYMTSRYTYYTSDIHYAPVYFTNRYTDMKSMDIPGLPSLKYMNLGQMTYAVAYSVMHLYNLISYQPIAYYYYGNFDVPFHAMFRGTEVSVIQTHIIPGGFGYYGVGSQKYYYDISCTPQQVRLNVSIYSYFLNDTVYMYDGYIYGSNVQPSLAGLAIPITYDRFQTAYGDIGYMHYYYAMPGAGNVLISYAYLYNVKYNYGPFYAHYIRYYHGAGYRPMVYHIQSTIYQSRYQ